MDFSILLSIIIPIIVTIAINFVSWYLSFLRGPDLSLIDEPKFELTDEGFKQRGEMEYVPTRFELKPTSFVFANNGRKSGTIVDLKLQITLHESIKDFYERFTVTFGTYEEPDLPVVIGEGDIDIIQASVDLDLINWKRRALAEVLDSNLNAKALVEKALERSKETFTKFCDFLDSTQEIGHITCTAKLSKGNDLKEETIGEYKIINNYDEALSSLRSCLRDWDNIGPNRNELLRELEDGLRGVLQEIRANIEVLKTIVDEATINKSRLRFDAWKRLQKTSYNRELRWFLMKSKEGLEESLTQLYRRITDYNSVIEHSLYLGDLRTPKEIQKINVTRIELLSSLEKIDVTMSKLS